MYDFNYDFFFHVVYVLTLFYELKRNAKNIVDSRGDSRFIYYLLLIAF